ncbi:hypothetical protein UR09_06585 [Candidatus Nitromaritima sp. SCGC AAA799-A02]|nr:hypothetical protein UR09_06585 [Candidatus Nitromaritima sp. SCGC AAA799-A02]
MFLKGWVLVVIIHGSYDTAVYSSFHRSYYAIAGMAAVGIYLGLKAKKDLERQSEFIESSGKEFFIFNKKEKHEPLALKDIRDSFADGRIGLEDVLISKRRGEKLLVREVLSIGIGTDYKRLVKIKPRGQSLKRFLIFYGLTFGIYFYFWFLKNYRDFKNHKGLNINPELRALALFILTTMPFYFFGEVLGALKRYGDPSFEFPLLLTISGTEAGFLFFQLRMIKGYLIERMKESFPILVIVLVFFGLSSLRKLIPSGISYYWLIEFVSILLQGGVLAVVQKDLNIYWKH